MSPAVSKAQARFLAMIEAKKKGKSKKAKKEETKEIFRGTSKKLSNKGEGPSICSWIRSGSSTNW